MRPNPPRQCTHWELYFVRVFLSKSHLSERHLGKLSQHLAETTRDMKWNNIFMTKIFETKNISLSFTNGVSEANVVKWKGIKNRHKKISPARIWMGVRVSVCLCVCVSVCLSGLKSWISFDGMKGSWWNFQDQSNFSQVIFGRENQISRPKGYGPGPKTACF